MNRLYQNLAQLPISVRGVISEYDSQHRTAKEAAAAEDEGGTNKTLFGSYAIALVNARINDNEELTDALNARAAAAREKLVTRIATRLEKRAGGGSKKAAAPAAMPDLDDDDPSPEKLAAFEKWLEGGDGAQQQGPAQEHVTTAEGIVERFADAIPAVKGRRR